MRIKNSIEIEEYYLSLVKERSRAFTLLRACFSDANFDKEKTHSALKEYSSIDTIIKTIENNFTFYKEDK